MVSKALWSRIWFFKVFIWIWTLKKDVHIYFVSMWRFECNFCGALSPLSTHSIPPPPRSIGAHNTELLHKMGYRVHVDFYIKILFFFENCSDLSLSEQIVLVCNKHLFRRNKTVQCQLIIISFVSRPVTNFWRVCVCGSLGVASAPPQYPCN